jgi:hypothetical protein
VTDQLESDLPPFAIVPVWVLDAGLSSRAVHLYALLADHAGRDGSCFPSRGLLAERMSASVDTVDRAMAELLKAGAVVKRARAKGTGEQTSNLYTLRSAKPTADAPTLTAQTGAAPVRHRGRTDAAPGAAPVRHEQEPINQETPQPPARPGEPSSTHHGQHARCRACGTTPRQIAETQRRERLEAERKSRAPICHACGLRHPGDCLTLTTPAPEGWRDTHRTEETHDDE